MNKSKHIKSKPKPRCLQLLSIGLISFSLLAFYLTVSFLLANKDQHYPSLRNKQLSVASIDRVDSHPVSNTTVNEIVINTIQRETAAIFDQANDHPILTSTRNEPAVLVVGGTDGSGTRRVVDLLCQLGVSIISEDPRTYDIHADIAGGWPTFAHPLLKSTKSLIYTPTNLSSSVKETVETALSKILTQAKNDQHLPQSFRLGVGGKLTNLMNHSASNVEYAFNAPVSLLFVPILHDLLPSFKFLHVLRDGRDIAFSANHGPVDKFYKDMFDREPGVSDMERKSIQLWSDWNSQIYNWSLTTLEAQSRVSAERNKHEYSYFALHIEDIAAGSVAVKYRTMVELANWVGSSASLRDICCMAHANAIFLGSHDFSKSKSTSSDTVSSSYGKWRRNPNKALVDHLQEIGRPGLSLLGYGDSEDRSYQRLHSLNRQSGSMLNASEHSCEVEPSNCPVMRRPSSVPLLAVQAYSLDGVCSIELGTDYRTPHDIAVVDVKQSSPDSCCHLCQSTPPCTFFTLDVTNSLCYLKRDRGEVRKSEASAHLVSGTCSRPA